MLSCGEASGDLYAGALVEALRDASPGIDVFGLGGERFRPPAAGWSATIAASSVTGLIEALRVLPRFVRDVPHSWCRPPTRERPDVLVLIDYPDFNFRLMAAVRRLGVPIVYYVSPQLWAWRPGRMQTMKALVDRVLPIFPFEEPLYEREGMDVRFVGHPLIDLAVARRSRERASRTTSTSIRPSRSWRCCRAAGRTSCSGSCRCSPRPFRGLRRRVVGTQFIVARAPHLPDSYFAPFQGVGRAGSRRRRPHRRRAGGQRRGDHGVGHGDRADGAARQADGGRLSAVAAHLQAGQAARARVDRTAWSISWRARRVVEELIQEACTPEAVAREAVDLLTNAERVADMKEQLAIVRERLGGPGASGRAADAILEVARARRSRRARTSQRRPM